MFYSQFILAKKGPLGTIWIAAHLERKLRKNQVADTDIGVSVDSILFPDVPIALRLSSHLLLGVVRIYSRKVNYLFDDCSEALLKVKQAFRSAAVDLPPEESTAPYHSITLPETFDLDDFEIPNSDLFQGNYVDHHVSTKEQITLQDTMNGVVYSTSKFGLDERFGDGDTSHEALEFEEDMFLGKVPSHLDEASEPIALDSNAPPIFYGSSIQLPNLNPQLDIDDYAQAPSTPGLVKEPNISTVQEGLGSDDHFEPECHSTSLKLDLEQQNGASDRFMGLSSIKHSLGAMDIDSTNLEFNKGNIEVLSMDDIKDNHIAYNNQSIELNGVCGDCVDGRSCHCNGASCDIKEADLQVDVGRESQSCLELDEQDALISHIGNEKGGWSSKGVLPVCSSVSGNPDEDPLKNDDKLDQSGDEHVISVGDVDKTRSINDQELQDDSMTSELPAPEKLLSAPDVAFNMPINMLLGSTPNKESLEEFDRTSAKTKASAKRSFMDTVLPDQNLNSIASVSRSTSRRATDSLPKDDDLLSSILAGRRSTLRIRPSPEVVQVVASRKRARYVPRGSSLKRKVLVDDAMVLLGDTIRQQLTNTEDIRRLRKKAPCTRSEIMIIQRQFLEDEIFDDAVVEGMALDLKRLHSEKLDFNGIQIAITDRAIESMNDEQVKELSHASPSEGVAAQNEDQGLEDSVQIENRCSDSLQLLSEEADGRLSECDPSVERTDNTCALGELTSVNISEASAVAGLPALDKTSNDDASLVTSAVSCDMVVSHSHANSSNLSTAVCGQSNGGACELDHCTDNATNNSADWGEKARPITSSETDACVTVSGNVSKDQEGDKLCFNTDVDSAVSTGYGDNGQLSANARNEECKTDATSSTGPLAEANYGSLHDSDYVVTCSSGQHDVGDPATSHDADGLHLESADIRVPNDTAEFLIVDGDEDDEMAEDDEGGTEGTRIMDDSGWSSRTRAVANYLQSLFEKEAISGRTSLSVDNLLAGKSSKQASRMFFETLVLKTKDYIQVEQGNPYDIISVKPRAKLMKSDF